MDQMFFFSSNKIRFCSFGCLCMWVGWMLQVDDSFKIENTCKSVTFGNKKKKYPPFWLNKLTLSSLSALILLYTRNMLIHPRASCSPPRVPSHQHFTGGCDLRVAPLRHLVPYCTLVLRVEHSLEAVLLIEAHILKHFSQLLWICFP